MLKQKEIAFADSQNDAVLPSSEPLEQRIARLLWIWLNDPLVILNDGRDVQQHIATLLEPFLSDAFTYHSEGSKQGWWSDGVTLLQIEAIADTTFRPFGYTWSAGGWTPFEIEFYLAAKTSLRFDRTIVRFGWLDKNGNIAAASIHPRLRKPGSQISESQWAMAIELTPPTGT